MDAFIDGTGPHRPRLSPRPETLHLDEPLGRTGGGLNTDELQTSHKHAHAGKRVTNHANRMREHASMAPHAPEHKGD